MPSSATWVPLGQLGARRGLASHRETEGRSPPGLSARRTEPARWSFRMRIIFETCTAKRTECEEQVVVLNKSQEGPGRL